MATMEMCIRFDLVLLVTIMITFSTVLSAAVVDSSIVSSTSSSPSTTTTTTPVMPLQQHHALAKRNAGNGNAIQVCGSRLMETIKVVCKGNIFSGIRSKRSLHPLSSEAKLVRTRRSIINTCCKKACSLSELRKYCG